MDAQIDIVWWSDESQNYDPKSVDPDNNWELDR